MYRLHGGDTMIENGQLLNYIGGKWKRSRASEYQDVRNPATGETMVRVPLSPPDEVDEAIQAAQAAFPDWRRTPPVQRIQYLFKLKRLLDEHFDEIARLTVDECGKTMAESQGELRRGVENVEVATGIPTLMQGYNSEDIARGIDEHMFRQPVGVVAAITPFNFPGMIPLWYLPYAIACGGSSPVARYVYSRAAANGKRAQCAGGAKNPVVVLPDADMEMTTRIIADSSFGCAGQRCLATSVTITVGEAGREFRDRITHVAETRKVGYGIEPEIEMGPVITAESKQRIESLIGKGVNEGAKVLVDGRNASIPGYERGYFVRPTVLDNIQPRSELAGIEIFGPVLSLMQAQTIDEAIEFVNATAYGNMACLFTSSGAAARKFRYEAQAGNLGINIGVAAPMAFFPFSGWKGSFFGDMHAQGRDAIEFYTEKKVVIERWPREWSRRF